MQTNNNNTKHHSEHTPAITETELVKRLRGRCQQSPARSIIGVAGTPGSGKSTLASRLVRAINQQEKQDKAIVVPMDGFHYTNQELGRRGLSGRKGTPASFAAERFVRLIQRISEESSSVVYAPLYSREIHEPIEDAIAIAPQHQIIIVEGNYLLLPEPPWVQLKQYFDECWFLQIPLAVTRERLLQRHIRSGRTRAEALAKIAVDMENAALIMQTAARADHVL